ncbi:MAG: Glyoxylate/hydroxypyruvate reductase A [Alphaproteobacteria bacterium MarineAlpha5_Bin9]|nr:MAG: Glyoxylate/hydroxypyruvate reductase A [Alphaproteobacteria bacterium MarineAlpha5_Bin9]|tara:strand:+ start:1843 stop:2772 length:930 start_codon:yes stop_codon:yes gene_type:complete
MILFHCTWHDKTKWLNSIKKTFTNYKIYTIYNCTNFSKIKYAIIWQLPDKYLKKLNNIELIFSLGAGVDHIISLPSYNKTPIIRLKDQLMAERMSNHIISQVLNYQLNLKLYYEMQKKKKWINFLNPIFNKDCTIGIIGIGFLGKSVAESLLKLGYNVQGFKRTQPLKKCKFKVYYQKRYLKNFLKTSNIVLLVLPNTSDTLNFVNKQFLSYMKSDSLLINVGRGSSINEDDLFTHMKRNKNFHASLDVFKKEPLPKKSKLWNLKNVIITPHVASITVIDSAVQYYYKTLKKINKSKKVRSDVDINRGY